MSLVLDFGVHRATLESGIVMVRKQLIQDWNSSVLNRLTLELEDHQSLNRVAV